MDGAGGNANGAMSDIAEESLVDSKLNEVIRQMENEDENKDGEGKASANGGAGGPEEEVDDRAIVMGMAKPGKELLSSKKDEDDEADNGERRKSTDKLLD